MGIFPALWARGAGGDRTARLRGDKRIPLWRFAGALSHILTALGQNRKKE